MVLPRPPFPKHGFTEEDRAWLDLLAQRVLRLFSISPGRTSHC